MVVTLVVLIEVYNYSKPNNKLGILDEGSDFLVAFILCGCSTKLIILARAGYTWFMITFSLSYSDLCANRQVPLTHSVVRSTYV